MTPILIPTPLRAYTGKQDTVHAARHGRRQPGVRRHAGDRRRIRASRDLGQLPPVQVDEI